MTPVNTANASLHLTVTLPSHKLLSPSLDRYSKSLLRIPSLVRSNQQPSSVPSAHRSSRSSPSSLLLPLPALDPSSPFASCLPNHKHPPPLQLLLLPLKSLRKLPEPKFHLSLRRSSSPPSRPSELLERPPKLLSPRRLLNREMPRKGARSSSRWASSCRGSGSSCLRRRAKEGRRKGRALGSSAGM
jgi:hypothetical protein